MPEPDRSFSQLSLCACAAMLLSCMVSCHSLADESHLQTRDVPELSGLRRGLSVVIGPEPDIASAIYEHTGLSVHCLVPDEEGVQKTRAALSGLGIYGPVSVSLWRDRPHLPYADSLVMLLAVPEYGGRTAGDLSTDEILRVLAPRGVAAIGGLESVPEGFRAAGDGGWTLLTDDFFGNSITTPYTKPELWLSLPAEKCFCT